MLGGKPRIDGTRIAVEHIAIYYNQGLSIDEIVDSFQGITHADVFTALAYYYHHKAEIDAKIERDEKEFPEFLKKHCKPIDINGLRKRVGNKG